MLRCETCKSEMILTNTYKMGRHHKELYKCVNCKNHIVKNGKLIPNIKRVNYR